MSIKVICIGSKLDLKIKSDIESIGQQLNLRNQYTVRWGNWLDDREEGITFNTAQAIKNSQDKETMLLMLRRHHINCPVRIKPGKKTEFPILGRKYEHECGTDIRFIDSLDEYKLSDCDYFVQLLNIKKEYKIHVMDLSAFYVEEKYTEKNQLAAEVDIRTKAYGWNLRKASLDSLGIIEKENIVSLAQRAIYGLGLDFGVVNIGINPEGKAFVLDVDAYCTNVDSECKEAYIRQFVKTIRKYEALKGSSKEITIGADPECIIKDKRTGDMIFASEFFANADAFGLDDRSIEAGKKCFPLMEIRPKYSTNPVDVVNSMKAILNEASKGIKYSNIGLYAGSMPAFNYWTGGHVHFGIKPNAKLIRALDNYLALPILMIENPYTARRRMIKYGALGNYRLKFHGGFEYCTLSSWLVSPRIALGVLCLAKIVAQEYLNFHEYYLDTYSDMRAYYLVNKNYFKDKIQRIVNTIIRTDTYKKYEEQLEPILERIIQCPKWKENRDIKEAWELQNSEEIYKLTARCYIPKIKRRELSVKLDDNISIKVSGKNFNVKVYPKDDLTSDKQGYVSFSEDICNEIPCSTDTALGIWKEKDSDNLRVGPIFGILSYKEECEIGPFGKQSYYFRKLIKISKDKGMITFVFTLSGIDWKQKLVNGYTYDFRKNQWKMDTFPLPDVIYDRGDFISEENFGTVAAEYKAGLIENDIKSINSLECINLTNNKWKVCKLLESGETTKAYQVETCQFLSDKELINFLSEYNHVFLKPNNGSRSKGIFSIEKKNKELYECVYRDEAGEAVKREMDLKNTINIISNEIEKLGYRKDEYIIQRAIPLVKYNDTSFEIRVVMQKNSLGFWLRTCMIARVAEKDEKFINTLSEKDVKSSPILKACFESNYELIRNKLRKASKDVTELIDDRGIIAGEISIDFGIDKDFNIYIIEINSKPDNLLSSIGAFKMRNLAINRVLEYGKSLVVK